MVGEGNYTTRVSAQFLREVAPDGSQGRFRLLLYDFDTGRDQLGSRHIEALGRYILPRLAPNAPPCRVWIGGIASRRGDTRFNEGLAWARAARVEHYLLRQSSSLGNLTSRHSLRTTWHGERYSVFQSENSGYYRAVLIVISMDRPRRPEPAPPPTTEVHRTNRFRIRWDWGGDGDLVVGMGVHTYVIDYDPGPGSPASDPVWYRHIGVGMGLGFGAGSGDASAPWNEFVSQRVTTTRDFGGTARATSMAATAGRGGASRLTFTISPGLVPEETITFDPFEAPEAFSVSLGFGTIVGPFFADQEYTARRRRRGGA